ncbi:lysylphosphatidylglycerol synthase transmembrane domain-containing protein [Bernardetia sp.]|uniref:lysylphosphatidylglycerol synthase transmembrane domain-containing protein n=1 Tax=Bernardetia sp. TaxID=1937974 RepID=UPI0025BA7EC5|nr:lysylphosphatidylglycerol synthase transmembrane domain-containing protein [Bernardetia sp.]
MSSTLDPKNTQNVTAKTPDEKEVFKTLNVNKIYIPVLIGLGITVYLAAKEIDFTIFFDALKRSNWIWFIAAFLMLLARDAGYVQRIKMISDNELSWKSSLYIILLWEFASAVTPSVVGGTAVAVFILNQEGLSFGKSMAYVMMTALLDNFFFIVFAPLAIFVSNTFDFAVFPVISANMFNEFVQQQGLKGAFYVSYGLTVIYALFFVYGLFINPRGFKWLLVKATSFGFLKRFQSKATQAGNEMIIAAVTLRGSGFSLWIKAIFLTFFIWIARYLMLNCLISAFTPLEAVDHLFVFARQIAMWIVMLLSPTPGSSGTAEAVFCLFYVEYLREEFCAAVGILWRMFYYYPYLFIGFLILPRWITRINKKRQAKRGAKQ